MKDKKPPVQITMDGPYRVSTEVPLSQAIIRRDDKRVAASWEQGRDYDTGELGVYYLCRCGRSKNKPFCDGHHETTGFVGDEKPENAPYRERATRDQGTVLDLLDDPSICAGAGFCELNGTVWRDIHECENSAVKERVVDQIARCPSGRLSAMAKDDHLVEAEFSQEIKLVEDPDYECRGPLWVSGCMEVEDHKGRPFECRNRVTLCRCGESRNKPFCDSSHYDSDNMKGVDE